VGWSLLSPNVWAAVQFFSSPSIVSFFLCVYTCSIEHTLCNFWKKVHDSILHTVLDVCKRLYLVCLLAHA
jgi:hypothetical protein